MQIRLNTYTESFRAGIPKISIVTKNGNLPRENAGDKELKAAASVFISRKGRDKLAQSLKQPEEEQSLIREKLRSASGADAEDSYLERLQGVKEKLTSIATAKDPQPSREDIEKMQRAQADMRRMKQFQEETEQQKERELREAKAQDNKWRSEVDRDKGDLLVMLESFEESEKKQEEREGKKSQEEASGDKPVHEPQKLGTVLTGYASRLTGAAMGREELLHTDIQNVEDEGVYRLKKAKEEYQSFMQEYDVISRAIAEEDLTEEQKSSLVSAYEEKARGGNFRPGGYEEIEKNRKRGLAERQFARDLRREARGVIVMPAMQKIKGELEDAASDTVLNDEAVQQLDQASADLQERVQEKLDERNDIAGGDADAAEKAKEEEAAAEAEREEAAKEEEAAAEAEKEAVYSEKNSQIH
ncbi:MAG: hypothetical protein NC355_05485 [Blautia sp.]|nr:hypothetical protein [Blautia sp.]